MPRPPLLIGTWGKIRRATIAGQPTAFANYRDSSGRTRTMQRNGRTEPEAERNLIAALKKKLDDESTDLLAASSTIAELADQWLEELRLKKTPQGTIVTYRSAIQANIKPGIGALRLSEATVPRVDRFLKNMLDRPSAARTARIVLAGMFKLAVRHGAVSRNPVPDTMPIATPKKPVKAKTLDHIHGMRKLFAEYDASHTSELWETSGMLMGTGCRIGECLALRWDHDTRLDSGVVEINGTLIVGEDGKLHWQEHPKSEAGERALTLPATMRGLLVARRVSAMYEQVFPSSTGTWRWPANVRRQWRQALEGSVYAGATPKDFRRAVATHLDREVGVKAAAQQLGHGNEDITIDYYIERQRQIADFAEVIESLFENAG
ncbi:MAG: tyrosine-type recombinase/integrase [Microbacterium sp.]|uniref:site-specific integrase n=1 Tax=Microbacterium sp. TaxID=51671 RepID=UPI001AD21C29|nr:tyrosine-type recombinase/integrase [Microbacterium sp.]MBN9176071.1 tyrosine-type recombinase/integrase [Microbacterium sp.]